MSANIARELCLKPTVFAFAMLLPMTSRSFDARARPLKPVENPCASPSQLRIKGSTRRRQRDRGAVRSLSPACRPSAGRRFALASRSVDGGRRLAVIGRGDRVGAVGERVALRVDRRPAGDRHNARLARRGRAFHDLAGRVLDDDLQVAHVVRELTREARRRALRHRHVVARSSTSGRSAALPASLAGGQLRRERLSDVFNWPMPVTVLICASCEVICELSAGLVGSWFFSCVTSSVRNVF